MGKTTIEWTQMTWNPVRGCSRVSEGCRHCYAERMAARALPGMNSPTTGEPFAVIGTPSKESRWTGHVELIPSMLDIPLRWWMQKNQRPCDFAWPMMRAGKKSAGHLLDGQEWRQIPEVKQPEVKRVVKR